MFILEIEMQGTEQSYNRKRVKLKKPAKAGMMAQVFNPCTWEAETDGSLLSSGQPGL